MSLHGGSTMPGYDLSVTRAAMMSVSVTEPSKSSLLMLDDLGSASKAAVPSAYSNNTNLSTDFISAKVLLIILCNFRRRRSCASPVLTAIG